MDTTEESLLEQGADYGRPILHDKTSDTGYNIQRQ